MGRIVILDENTSNQIAAGEVVERPASVVKELVENSIDAGSTSVSVEINNGGISLIKVVDNGSGIEEDDVEIAFERHATSKIRSSCDLESISTLGFRGEALASIASVASVELTTRVKDKPYGRYLKIQGGVLKESNQTGCPVGTSFSISNLFYNTPARFKFLKKDSTEAGYISDIVGRIALGNPHISIRLTSNRSTVLHTPGNNDLLSTIFSLYGKEAAKECIKVEYRDEKVKISGYAGKPEIARSNRNHQSIFINGRYIRNKVISSAIDEAYKTYLLKNKFAFIVLNIEINSMLVDVNVHPTKMEVRFSGEQDIFRAVYHAVNNALLSKSLIRNVEFLEKQKNYFTFEDNKKPAIDYKQQKIDTTTINEPETKNSADLPQINEKPSVDKNTAESVNKANVEKNELSDNFNSTDRINIEKASIDKKYTDTSREDVKDFNIERNNQKEDEKTVIRTNTHESRSVNAGTDESLWQETKIQNTEHTEERVLNGEKNEDTKDILLNSKIIGQAFFTYILLQNEDNLIVIDQHAAHERIKYEELRRKYRDNESMAQYLLTPAVVELTDQEIRAVEEDREMLNRLGFIFENFGNNSVIVRSVPLESDDAGVRKTFLEIVDYIVSNDRKGNRIIEDEVLYTIACKAAIKANKRLEEIEIKGIIEKLLSIENPHTCPHGRPVIIKISKYQFEKMFKRII
ncbi:MAG: DNA mismatch repair endonuclease MutL [Clostridiaceae bacterium]|nr:DNA mismatch repair endonuclease MutL [Clostridiaceae bacterium]